MYCHYHYHYHIRYYYHSLFQAFGQWSAARRKRARNKIKRKRGKSRDFPSLSAVPHISLRCPHDLNASNRLLLSLLLSLFLRPTHMHLLVALFPLSRPAIILYT